MYLLANPFELLHSGWVTFLGLSGVFILLISLAVFFGVWPLISAAATPIVSGFADWAHYYLEDLIDGFQDVVDNGHAILFVLTLAYGVHLMDKWVWIPQADCKAAIAQEWKKIRAEYRLIEKTHK